MTYAIIYIILCLAVPFGAERGRKNVALLAVMSLLLFVFVAFRWEIGCDWIGYQNIFEKTRYNTLGDSLADREPGFALVNFTVHALGLDYFYINIASAVLFFGGLFLLARRQENPMAIVALAFPVLIMNAGMTQVRQGIAIAFFMVAMNFFRDGKRLPYAAAVLAGGTFHQSALLFLAMTPLIRWKRSLLLIGVSALVAMPVLYLILGDIVGFYSERYFNDPRDSAGGPYRAALLGASGLFFLLFLRKRWSERFSDDYDLFLVSAVLMLTILPLTMYSPIIGDRIGYYLVPPQIVMFERLAVLFRWSVDTLILTAAPYFFLLLFLIVWMNSSAIFAGCYLPYQSIILGVGQ